MGITKEMRYERRDATIKTIKYLCQRAKCQTPTMGIIVYATVALSFFVK